MAPTTDSYVNAVFSGTNDSCLNVGFVKWPNDELWFWCGSSHEPEVLSGRLEDGGVRGAVCSENYIGRGIGDGKICLGVKAFEKVIGS